jgi:hypothetical protein
MTNRADHSFRLESTSYKSRDLIYDEPGHRLVVYLEMSGVRRFDWVGCDTDFAKWTEPAGELISPRKRTEILGRLAEWAREQRLRIGISPPMDWDAYFAEQEKHGSRVERRPDGTVAVYPPQGRSFWARLVGLTRAFLDQWRS